MHQSGKDRNADSQFHEVRVSLFCSTAGLIHKFESREGEWNPGVWFAVRVIVPSGAVTLPPAIHFRQRATRESEKARIRGV